MSHEHSAACAGGCGIDVHTHVVPEHFPAYVGKGADIPWPSMQHTGCGHAHVLISGKRYRTVERASWDSAARVADLDRMRLARQVLSPMPELLSYWLPAPDAQSLLRYLNDSIASMVRTEPARFLGLGAVPLQDVDLAIRELEYVVKDLRLQGVEIATHVNGVSIGHAAFNPFFQAAAAMGACVFVHGLRPAGADRLIGPEALAQVVAFPGDVALAGASLVTGGMLERHPALRLALSHGGGAFPTVLHRLAHGWRHIPAVRDSIAVDPLVTARRLYCDTLTYDADTLHLAMKVFGSDRVMIGTDYPFAICDRDPLASLAALELTDDLWMNLARRNAEAFLGLA
jgi:aminocarboxymuconate-semialdehyde decarboxylase